MVEWGFLKFSADAQKCYEELLTIGKTWTPEQVLELARNPKTELHKCFDWNDTTAAEKWRIQQARKVCMSITVKVEQVRNDPIKIRVIQHDPEERAYRPIVYTLRNDDEYSRLLNQAKKEMIAFRNRYKSITELEGVMDEIEAALAA